MPKKARKEKLRDWIPVHRGRIYCSPACGGGCTRGEYLRAVKAAEDLCKELGPGWKPHINENLGWHYRAKLGPLEVTPRVSRGKVCDYTAWYQQAFGGHGNFLIDGKTPKKALKNLFEAMFKMVDEVLEKVEELKKLRKKYGSP